MTEHAIVPAEVHSPLSVQDVARAIQDGGVHQLAINGRAMVMRGRRGIIIMSLESPNTGYLVRIEEV